MSAPGDPSPTRELPVAEATVRAVIMGVAFGALFGAANAYLGLRVGLTVATSIPIAVMTVAVLRAVGARASILEGNLAQTIGSASTSLATGAIFTLPALYMWGDPPSYLQVVGLTLCGGILGVSAMIPLRRLLIVRGGDELPYPEGRACAEVLRATTAGSTAGVWIFRGLVLGAAAKLLADLAGLAPADVVWAIPEVPNGELSIAAAPALLGVGYILGYRQSAVAVSGGVISALLLIPLITTVLASSGQVPPDATGVWKSYVRYIGTGAVACAGIVTVARGLPAMVRAFVAVARGLGSEAGSEGGGPPPRTDRDVPGWVIGAGIGSVALAVVLIPGLLGGDLAIEQRAVVGVGVAVFGLVFVAVASRIVGIIGVSSQPTSGICLVTLLGLGVLFTTLGWTSHGAKLALLTAGTIVATAASKAGDISQDLKTGQLVGATPRTQQIGQYLGAFTACWAVAATIMFLGETSSFGPDGELKAPQATLMRLVIDGQIDGSLPWGLVLAGAGLAAGAMLAGLQGLAFAIGVYLPLSAMAPIFVGGVTRRMVDGWNRPLGGREGGASAGILAASGLVAGEGLAGVLIAGLVGAGGYVRPAEPTGAAAIIGGLTIVAITVAFLYKAGRSERGVA